MLIEVATLSCLNSTQNTFITSILLKKDYVCALVYHKSQGFVFTTHILVR